MSVGRDVPSNRVTPAMLAALASCPRKYRIEHEQRLRLRGDTESVRGVLSKVLAADFPEAAMNKLVNAATLPMPPVLVEANAILSSYIDSMRRGRVGSWEQGNVLLRNRILKPLIVKNERWRLAVPVTAVVEGPGEMLTCVVRIFGTRSRPQEYQSELETSMLFWPHCWAVGSVLGRPVRRLLVEVVRLRVPPEPDTLTAGGLSRRAVDTSAFVYRRALARLPSREGGYPEETARLAEIEADERYAYDLTFDLNPSVVEGWVEDAVYLLRSIRRYRTAKYWPRNSAACEMRGGGCPHRRWCSRPWESDNAPYVMREDRYPGIDEGVFRPYHPRWEEKA